MTFKKFLFFFSLVLSLGIFSSCGSDEADCANAAQEWSQDVNDEFDVWFAAGQTWGANQTPENCTAYKNALQDYIDAVKTWADCLDGNTEWENSLAGLEAQIASLC